MKPYFLTSTIFPFVFKARVPMPEQQIRKLGLLYSIYRFIICVFLFMSSYVIQANNKATTVINDMPSLLHQSILLFYGLFSLLLLAFFFFTRSDYDNQLSIGLALDVVFISVLMYISGAPDIQLTLLYIVVVAASFILLVPYQAVIITMLAVIFVIYQQFFISLNHDVQFNHIGEALLLSISFIGVGFLSWTLTQRLAKVEKIAAKNADEIAKLNAITQEVISEMQQGVLVLNEYKQIMISNHASRMMLSLNLDTSASNIASTTKLDDSLTSLHNINQKVQYAIHQQHAPLFTWLEEASTNTRSQFIYQVPNPTNASIDKLRVSTSPLQDGIILVMVEDLRREQTNAQQLKLASLGQLTASIAHEIRNPLAAISQASELLMMDDNDWNQQQSEPTQLADIDPNIELYRMIFKQTKRVNRIIEDVLKLSRQAKPEQQKIEMVEWIGEFINNHFKEHDVFLHSHCECLVYFDPHQLEQILINLINNGLRFSSKAHPHAFVEIDIYCQKNDVILDVLDSGVGVSEDKQDNLFMPFFTTDNEGTGLGLYLSQAFAEANFSRLIYVPEHKKTCFRLLIPKAVMTDADTDNTPTNTIDSTDSSFK